MKLRSKLLRFIRCDTIYLKVLHRIYTQHCYLFITKNYILCVLVIMAHIKIGKRPTPQTIAPFRNVVSIFRLRTRFVCITIAAHTSNRSNKCLYRSVATAHSPLKICINVLTCRMVAWETREQMLLYIGKLNV